MVMTGKVRIALDAMGGDHGPSIVLAGAAHAMKAYPSGGIGFLLFGNTSVIAPLLLSYPELAAVSTVHHAEVAIRMDDKPSQALRYGRRKSSMWLAIEAVRSKEADVALSAGNTGALMAMSRFCLRTMAGIERPALAALWPTLRGSSVVLDVGASIGADAHSLVDMAVMGAAMARIVLDIQRPTVGLLNIGVEEVKGLEMVREAGRILREADLPMLDYKGFVEGDDVGKGTADVVVTEGFAGNIALKTAEGTAKQIMSHLREAMAVSWTTKLGSILARSAFASLKAKLDPRNSNGAVFLGLNGIVIKSHGGTDATGFGAAIDIAYDMVKYELMHKITDSFEAYRSRIPFSRSPDGAEWAAGATKMDHI